MGRKRKRKLKVESLEIVEREGGRERKRG